MHPCMDNCCHVSAGAPSCHLGLLDKLLKQICRTVGPSFAAYLKPLIHQLKCCQLKSFLQVLLVDVHLNWLNWLHFLILEGGLLVIPDRLDCMIFLSPFIDIKCQIK